MNKLFKGFYFITDHSLSINGNVKDVELALQAGVKIIQYREKNRERKSFYDELIEIKDLCKVYNALLIINDDVNLAKEVDADGVHVGQNDLHIQEVKKILGENKIIGVSTKSLSQAFSAQKQGASYIGIGHIFPTNTKIKTSKLIGTEILKDIKTKLLIPVAAIGGINIKNAKSVIDTGVDMVCAISDSLKNGTVKENIEHYFKLFQSNV
jgi:thiamine-phosphate pyrophosphorylase